MSERICPICNKPLPKDAYPNAVYCSDACRREKRRQLDKIRREFLRAHGICIQCGQRNAKKGHSHCSICIADKKDYTAIKHARWKDQGLCTCCGKPRAEGATVCNECLEYQRSRQHRVRQERIASGICTICGKRKATDGKKTCTICREKHYRKAA